MLGESFAIEELRDFIVGVSILPDPVLLTGGKGTGKSLAASKIHAVGRTACLKHLQLDCDDCDAGELERVLFGGEGDQPGALNSPDTSSCYLSRIEALTPRLVDRLTQHLMTPVANGAVRPRIVFGSRYDLSQLLERGEIDSAFLDLISRYSVRIPPLAERIEDIPILCSYQIWLNSPPEEYDERWDDFQEYILSDLLTYPWPGNVSELIEVIRSYCGLAPGETEAWERPVSEESTPSRAPAGSQDALFLQQAFQLFYEEFLTTIELEQLSGRHDIVIADSSVTNRIFDEHN